MEFKRLVSGVCAASIAVTQTAVVPISVSASSDSTTQYTYKAIEGFTNQFTATLSVGSTTGTKDWDHDAWDAAADETSSNKIRLDSNILANSSTPDSANDLVFSIACDIDDGYYQAMDEFDFKFTGLTATLTKTPDDMVEETPTTVDFSPTGSDTTFSVGAFPNAIAGSIIKVTYTATDTDGCITDITDKSHNSFSKSNTSDGVCEAVLNDETAEIVADNGFWINVYNAKIDKVEIIVPEHSESGKETETEIIVSNTDETFTLVRDIGGWFNGGLDLVTEQITFSDFKDFKDYGALTVEWDKVECTATRRISFSSINSELWSGDVKIGNWDGANVVLPPFEYAEKNSRLTVEYEVNAPENTDDEWYCMLKFYDRTTGNWENLIGLHPNEDDDGAIPLDKNSSSITVTLTQEAAEALNKGGLLIGGSYINIKSVTSSEAEPNSTIAVNSTNFPDETFRQYVSENIDLDKDGELSVIECGKVRNINIGEPNEDDDDKDEKQAVYDKYKGIADFTGIENFTNLEYLSINGNESVKTINISACANITCADLGNCSNLQNVSLPESIKAAYLYCTSISELDLSKCKSLELLIAFDTKLTKLDTSKNTELTELCLGGSAIPALDLSKNTLLTEFSSNETRVDISLTNRKFDLNSFADKGLDLSKVTLDEGQNLTVKNGVITAGGDVSEIRYTYDTGLNGKELKVVLNITGKSFDSVNAELWSGECHLTHKWGNNILLPAFDKAAKDTRLTVEYEITEPDASELVGDGQDGTWTPQLQFIDNRPSEENPDGSWKQLMDLHPDQEEWGSINLDKNSTSITVVLTEEAAKALNDGYMFITGCDVTVTSVKSLEKDSNTHTVSIDSVNFPDETFRQYVSENIDLNKDGELSVIECGKVRSIDFHKPDEGEDDEEAKQAVYDKYKGIADFTGIEKFTNLEYLSIKGNEAVNTLDISACTKITCIDLGNCSNLKNVSLPESIEEAYLYCTSISELDLSKCKSLKLLIAFDAKLKNLDLKNNPNLTDLNLSNNKFESNIDFSNNTKLIYIDLGNCGITSADVSSCPDLETLVLGENDLTNIDLSKNTKLKILDLSQNYLVSIDLTGLNDLNTDELILNDNTRAISTRNNTFDLKQFAEYGLDPEKVTIAEDQQAVLNGSVITFEDNAESVTYTYDSGIEGKPLTVTLTIDEKIKSTFTVSYEADGKTNNVACESWANVIKAVNNKNIDYTITVNEDVNVGKLTLPAATKANSVTLECLGDAKTITTTAPSVTFPTDVTLKNISIESTAKTFTITASKDLTINDFSSKTLTNLKGGAKSTLKITLKDAIDYNISGFGTIAVSDSSVFEFKGTVKATNLELEGIIRVGKASVTFTNIICSDGYIDYTEAGFTPITVTGNITLAENSDKLYFSLYTDDALSQFSTSDTILVAKAANLSNIEIDPSCLPDDEVNYTLGRVGSNVKIMAEAFILSCNGSEVGTYAQWSDVLALIAANAKAGNKDYAYYVALVSDYDMNGTFKMPAANTYSNLYFKSQNEPKTINFTGNISLTGETMFNAVNLVSQKKVKNEVQSVEFSISAGKNPLYLINTDSKIKSITSSSLVLLDDVTVGTINANIVVVNSSSTSSNSIDSLAALSSLADLDSFTEFAANAEEWTGKDAPETNVNITGNLTAKNGMLLLRNTLYVGGILNTGGVASFEGTIVVNKQAKNKYPLTIGKEGFSGNTGINFVLIDPETGKTAKITDETVLGTISGPYADQLIPSNDNLEAEDSYYIIKSGNKLIAKPKDTAGLVEVTVNGNTAYYKSLDEAIKDINATGKATDRIEIKLTQDMFKAPIAKLPLPNAGKYGKLYLSADSDITINLTGDLTLTGELVITQNVHINKVKVTGKGENAKTEVVPISVNVGKYEFYPNSALSASEDEPYVSRIANISGTGTFYLYNNTVIAGKVTNTMIGSNQYEVKLEGASASFSGSFRGLNAKFIYDKSIAKNVKFKDLNGSENTVLVITDGNGTAAFAENSVIASITGDYTGEVTVEGCDCTIVRSGNNLKAVAKDNVVTVEASTADEDGSHIYIRIYDSLTNAMTDISRIKDKNAQYTAAVKDKDVLVLPKANTYGQLKLTAKNNVKAVITTAKDLTLTGDLTIDENVFISKKNGSAMNLNLGNYELYLYQNAGIAYDAEKKVNCFTNISGKGEFYSESSCAVSGKVNVGTYSVTETTLGSKASFSAATVEVYEDDTLSYPISIAKNVKFNVINLKDNTALTLDIDGVKSGDQVAVLAGDYLTNRLKLADKDDFILVRSGNKLIAVDLDSENDENSNCVFVKETTSNKTRCYDSYANAIADINRLNDPDGKYTIYFLNGNFEFSKLALPTKGKYKSVTFSAFADDTKIEISVKSDITLTGDFEIDGYLTLKKSNGSTLKFTSPKNKDGSPLYNVTVGKNAKIVNGTLNGKEIVNPQKDSQTTDDTAA